MAAPSGYSLEVGRMYAPVHAKARAELKVSFIQFSNIGTCDCYVSNFHVVCICALHVRMSLLISQRCAR